MSFMEMYVQKTLPMKTQFCLRYLRQLLFIIICKDDVESKFCCAAKEMFEIDSWDPNWISSSAVEEYIITSIHCCWLLAVATVAIIVCITILLFFFSFCVCLFCSSVVRHRDSIWCELWMMRDKTGGYKSIHLRYRLATKFTYTIDTNVSHNRRKWIEFAIRHTQRT